MATKRSKPATEAIVGSLTQQKKDSSDRVVCGNCSSEEITRMDILNKNGQHIIYVSCTDCEESGWFDMVTRVQVSLLQVMERVKGAR